MSSVDVQKLPMPTRKCDLYMEPEDGAFGVKIWVKENLFHIENMFMEKDECIDCIRMSGALYYNAIEFIENVIIHNEKYRPKRKQKAMMFLTEWSLLDTTE